MASTVDVPAIDVRGIDFSYGHVQVLFDVDLHVDRGEVLALLGTNGPGKSTLLRVVSGLEQPSADGGTIGGGTVAGTGAAPSTGAGPGAPPAPADQSTGAAANTASDVGVTADPVSSQTQIPVAVQQMRSNGVTAVMLGADFISGQSFAQTGAAQGDTPFHGAADPWSFSTDYVVANMPDSFDGSITTTAWRSYDHRAGVPDAAIDAACAEEFEEDTGIDLDRTNDPDALYTGTLLACGVVQRFEKAALAVGPDLTRARLVQAIGNLGTIEIPFAGGPGTYQPGKLDGADSYRAQVWRKACKCWHPLVRQFQRGKH